MADFSAPTKPTKTPAAMQTAAPLSTWASPLMQAAVAFRDSYAEHLNHHCARCTKAWADLNEALASIPPR